MWSVGVCVVDQLCELRLASLACVRLALGVRVVVSATRMESPEELSARAVSSAVLLVCFRAPR